MWYSEQCLRVCALYHGIFKLIICPKITGSKITASFSPNWPITISIVSRIAFSNKKRLSLSSNKRWHWANHWYSQRSLQEIRIGMNGSTISVVSPLWMTGTTEQRCLRVRLTGRTATTFRRLPKVTRSDFKEAVKVLQKRFRVRKRRIGLHLGRTWNCWLTRLAQIYMWGINWIVLWFTCEA